MYWSTQLNWLFYSILFYSILFYSILFYSILFYSILFYSILFYSRILFNGLISANPVTEKYFGAAAKIVHSKTIENAPVKVQSSQAHFLNAEEKRSISSFSQTQVVDLSNGETIGPSQKKEKVDFAEKLLGNAGDEHKIGNLNWVPPTSNLMERLNSTATYVFSPHRKRQSFPFRIHIFFES